MKGSNMKGSNMKGSNMKRLITLVLALTTVIMLFAACNVKKGEENNNAYSPGTMVYVPEYISMPKEINDIRSMVFSGETLYFSANVKIGEETIMVPEYDYTGDMPMPMPRPFTAAATSAPSTADGIEPDSNEEYDDPDYTGLREVVQDVYATRIFRMNIDGSGFTELPDYIATEKPEGSMGSMDINSFMSDTEGNLWLFERGYFYHYDEYGAYIDDGSPSVIRKLDSNGKELMVLDLTPISKDNEYYNINNMVTDAAGNLYLTMDSILYVYDKNGKYSFNVETDNWIDNLIRLSDGTVGARVYELDDGALGGGALGGGYVLRVIDTETKSLRDETVNTPMNAYSFFHGGDEYEFCYVDSTNLYGYKSETGESVKLLNWIDCDIDGSVNTISVLPDGRIACVVYSSSYNYGPVSYLTAVQENNSLYELVVLKKVDASTMPQKTVLTLACFYMDYSLRSEIVRFNKRSDKYRIKVNDYSEYNDYTSDSKDGYRAGQLKLNTEIISGNIPDIILFDSSMPVYLYETKGLLEDLYPYIDKDPELSRDMLVSEVFKAVERDGKLYQVFSTFYVQTVAGDGNMIGYDMGWTIEDMMLTLANAPEDCIAFPAYTTRAEILNMSMYMGGGSFVDLKTGECNFDSDAFKKILEFAKSFPEEYDWNQIDWNNWVDENEMLRRGMLLMQNMYLSNLENYKYLNAMLGGNLVFKGFPVEDGFGAAYGIGSGLAISKKCVDKDGAWEFVRTILTEDYQNSNVWWNFPTNKACFDKMVDEAMQPPYYTDEYGNKIEYEPGSYYMNDGTEIKINPLSQEEVDKLIELLEKTNQVYYYDETIMEIITEETGAFFAGQKDAATTASIIQSRVMIYVSEQR